VAFGLAAALVPDFRVDGLWPAILGALVVGLVSWIVGAFTKGLAAK
jgi:putative membrane protein